MNEQQRTVVLGSQLAAVCPYYAKPMNRLGKKPELKMCHKVNLKEITAASSMHIWIRRNICSVGVTGVALHEYHFQPKRYQILNLATF